MSDPSILARIVDALAPAPEETVVEIGPGRGALTDRLVARAGRVIAIEIDRALAAMLRERYADDARVTVVEADALAVRAAELAGGAYALVGNLPYYITTPLIFHALERPRPRRAVVLVQREVAERMTAPAGSRAYGALSVNVQALAHVEMLFAIPAGAFQPPPTVESAVVRITPLADPPVPPAREAEYQRFVQRAFGLRRKQMRRVLRTIEGLSVDGADDRLARAGVRGDARPETLTPEEFLALLPPSRSGEHIDRPPPS